MPSSATELTITGWIKRTVRRILKNRGLVLCSTDASGLRIPDDIPTIDIGTIRTVKPYTMTQPLRIAAMCEAVRHAVRHNLPGAIVECGVWRGGSMMAAALTLQQEGAIDRDLFLFDTFAGMTEPTEIDTKIRKNVSAVDKYPETIEDNHSSWAYAPLESVRAAMETTGYPEELTHYIVGPVEETIPGNAPECIAVLRLDTDWYESTRHELDHLWGRLVSGGVLIVDDYGAWDGARKAVNEFLAECPEPLFLHRIDAVGRLIIKP